MPAEAIVPSLSETLKAFRNWERGGEQNRRARDRDDRKCNAVKNAGKDLVASVGPNLPDNYFKKIQNPHLEPHLPDNYLKKFHKFLLSNPHLEPYKGNSLYKDAAITKSANLSRLRPMQSTTLKYKSLFPSNKDGDFDLDELLNPSLLNDLPKTHLDKLHGPDGELHQKLRNLSVKHIKRISNEIMDRDLNVRWDDIAGLHQAKQCVNEMVIWPLLRPDIFKGCRSPGRGLLLFGPPGTGKTMIGKAIASEAKATFFHISASSLTSKWIGEGEKLVRALFRVASCCQPAVIFVDEIDSLLSKRKSKDEHEEVRRLKTQFLLEMEGCDSGNDQVLLIGATNRPEDLDEAARRRLTKRLYITLPSAEARAWIVQNLLKKDNLFKLSLEDMDIICNLTEGYSGSDMKNLVKDASMGPVREALKQGIELTNLNKKDMRSVTLQDFEDSLQEVRPSVSPDELDTYEEWNNQFGSLSSSKTCDSSQHRSVCSVDQVKDEQQYIGPDAIDHHKRMRETNLSDAQTCINIDDDLYEIPCMMDKNTDDKSEKADSIGQTTSRCDDVEIMEVIKGLYETMQAKIKIDEKRTRLEEERIKVMEIDTLFKDTSQMTKEMKQIYLKRYQDIKRKYDL
ncbi:fidgetin-like protein 1 [Tanacetum coccineum]